MSADKLSEMLWVDLPKPKAAPEDRVAQALQKALDSTTPERPGVPWDGEEHGGRDRRGLGIRIPGAD